MAVYLRSSTDTMLEYKQPEYTTSAQALLGILPQVACTPCAEVYGVSPMAVFNPNATSKQTGRKRARRLYPNSRLCEKCGARPESANIARHHKDGNTFNNAISNIQWLCAACHLAVHNYMRDSNRSPESYVAAREKVRSRRNDTALRPGDLCPCCKKRLYCIQTFYSRKDGMRYVYVGCPDRHGGCGHRVGSYTTPPERSV